MAGTAQYLLVLHHLEEDEGPPVSPGDVAAELDRSPSATTEMLQRLADRGLLTYEPYEGATLTEDGRRTAETHLQEYLTLCRFCRDVLHLDESEDEAMQLVGSISPLVLDRLSSTLLADEPAVATSD
ncbi:metal-dependent transcriptional regulator [Haloferax namakaokahaiae]|uniref:Metal-dependent transcriptional regulator n=1 Tax=Haloferax namakaokahaiae TaxID=1748331 RepID=A0ABD5ZDW0_9EURY